MTGDFEEELPEPESTVFKMTTKEIEITIIGIKGTSNYYICSSCGKKAALVGSLFNCESYKMKQRLMSDNKQWCARLFVQNTNTKEHLNIMVFHRHLHKYSSAMVKSWSGMKTLKKIKSHVCFWKATTFMSHMTSLTNMWILTSKQLSVMLH